MVTVLIMYMWLISTFMAEPSGGTSEKEKQLRSEIEIKRANGEIEQVCELLEELIDIISSEGGRFLDAPRFGDCQMALTEVHMYYTRLDLYEAEKEARSKNDIPALARCLKQLGEHFSTNSVAVAAIIRRTKDELNLAYDYYHDSIKLYRTIDEPLNEYWALEGLKSVIKKLNPETFEPVDLEGLGSLFG